MNKFSKDLLRSIDEGCEHAEATARKVVCDVRTAELRRMVDDARSDDRLMPEIQLFDRLEARYKDLAEKTAEHG